MTPTELQQNAELASAYAWALYHWRQLVRAELYLAIADNYWRQWIAAMEAAHV